MEIATDAEIRVDTSGAYERLRDARHRTLVAPEDDMWATFADLAQPYALTLGGRLVGRFSVDEDRQVHAFHVGADHEGVAGELFAHVVDQLDLRAAMASTVDPIFLSLALTAGGVAAPVALMYEHVAGPSSDEPAEVRLATPEDHTAAVAFARAADGSPEGFAGPYLARRIDLGELYLVEEAGRIIATGECRVDTRSPGNAHLGLVVEPDLRSRGLGTRLMQTLTRVCLDLALMPLCSTEPGNVAAQAVIRRAGFRRRHGVFRVHLPDGDPPPPARA